MTHLIGLRPIGYNTSWQYSKTPIQPKPRMLGVGFKSWCSVFCKTGRLLIIYSLGEMKNSSSRPINFPSQTFRIVLIVCFLGFYFVKVSEEINIEQRLVMGKVMCIQITSSWRKRSGKNGYKISWSKPTYGKSIILSKKNNFLGKISPSSSFKVLIIIIGNNWHPELYFNLLNTRLLFQWENKE